MTATRVYLALENIKTGEYIGIHPILGGLLRSSPGDGTITIGGALRDISAGEEVEYIPGEDSKDVSNKRQEPGS